jgi:hypothetical protein
MVGIGAHECSRCLGRERIFVAVEGYNGRLSALRGILLVVLIILILLVLLPVSILFVRIRPLLVATTW